jgi:hypothetical protein
MKILKSETETERLIRLAREDAAKKQAELDAGGTLDATGTSDTPSNSRTKVVGWTVTGEGNVVKTKSITEA